MKRLQTLVFGVFLLYLGSSQGAPREKRWIPERMSDYDYGLETQTFPTGSSSDGHGSNSISQPSYFSYWSDFYPGVDYSGMFYRANQDSNHGAMDPVQQLQNVQHYAYAQSLYPQGYPYPPAQSPPPDIYEADPSGRALKSFNQAQSHQSANPFIVMNRQQQPMSFIMGNNQVPSMFPMAGFPQQMFFVPTQTTQFQLPQQSPESTTNPFQPVSTLAALNALNGMESPGDALLKNQLQSLQDKQSASQAALLLDILNNRQNNLDNAAKQQKSEATNALIQASLNKMNQQQASEQAKKQDVEDTSELLEALKLARELAQPSASETVNEKFIMIMEESSVQPAQTHHEHPQKESQKHANQEHPQKGSQKHTKQVHPQTAHEKEGAQQHPQKAHEKEGAQQHPQKAHEKEGAQQHPQKAHEKEDAQEHPQKAHEKEDTHPQKAHEKEDTHPQKAHEKEDTQEHPQKKLEKESAHQKKTAEVDQDEIDTEDEKTNEKQAQAQKAKGRAHEANEGVYSAPNYEDSLANESPVDLIYPGVMVPAQNKPPMHSYYYSPSEYGRDHQYSPKTVPSGSGYGFGQSYQPQPPTQYANPYISSQLPYQGYQFPVPSSALPPYSPYYYPPRVTRNSAPMPVVQYVYGGKIFPKFG